jgi:hypothetical protein
MLSKSFIIIACLFTIALNAQARKVKGYFVTYNDDTVKATFFIGLSDDYLRAFSPGIIYDTGENSHKFIHPILRPNIAKKVVFIFRNKRYTLVPKFFRMSQYNIKTSGRLFVEVKDDSEFLFLGALAIGKSKEYVLQKGNDTLFDVIAYQKNELFQYFSDCPEVADEVKALFPLGLPGDFDIKLKKIVRKYNQACGSKMKLLKQ